MRKAPITAPVCVVDTNVVVSGLIGMDKDSPPARILDAMLDGDLVSLMSEDLLIEYSSVLRRANVVRLHGLSSQDLDRLLADLVANAMWRKPTAATDAPDTGDQHLWALLASHPHSRIVTGDQLLHTRPPSGASVISPRQFVSEFSPSK